MTKQIDLVGALVPEVAKVKDPAVAEALVAEAEDGKAACTTPCQ